MKKAKVVVLTKILVLAVKAFNSSINQRTINRYWQHYL